MNESILAKALFRSKSSNIKFWLNNFTPKEWWECDVCWITKNGYSIEHEIKCSIADLRADLKKERRKLTYFGRHRIWLNSNKWDLMENGGKDGPNRFFIVSHLPEIEKILPSWVGFKLLNSTGKLVTVRPARLLHRHKGNWAEQMKTVGYYRWAYRYGGGV